MRTDRYRMLIAVVLFFCIGVFSQAGAPQVPSGTWGTATTAMADLRTGASAAQLRDGRVLVTGGIDVRGASATDGVLASADLFDVQTGFSSAAPMNVARSRHNSVLLADGRVLVVGGTTIGGSATASVEVYDAANDSWEIAGSLLEPRMGAIAVLLRNGQALVAGGESSGIASSTFELFDPAAGASMIAGTLSAPRVGHAAAMLKDGRVLIVGGSDMTAALSSADIFDPTTVSTIQTDHLSIPRVGLTATTLPDGSILIAGGSNGSTELASAEVFDAVSGTFALAPSTLNASRRDHLAFLLPNNNSVLIVGGIAAGSGVPSTELYIPWTGEFRATGAPSMSRVGAAGSVAGNAPARSQLLLLAGGSGLASAEGYGFATLETDKDDYAPGTVVNITGSGWQPGERVTLVLKESPDIDEHPPMTAVADESGNIVNHDFAPDEHDIGIHFSLTASGAGSQARVTFSDSAAIATTTTLSPLSSTQIIGQSVVAPGQVSADPAVPDGSPVQFQVQFGGCGAGLYFTLASITATTSGGAGGFSGAGTIPAFAGTFGLRTHFPSISDGANTWAESDSACQPITIVDGAKLTVTTIVVNKNGGTKTVSDFPLFVDGAAISSGAQTVVTVGAHTVSATGVTGYVATIGGDCAANGAITLAAGDVKACTITNSDAGLSIGTATTLSAIASPLVVGQAVVAPGQVSASPAVPNGAPVQFQVQLGGCLEGSFFPLASILATTSGGAGSFSGAGAVPALAGTYGIRAHFAATTVGGSTWAASDSACQTVTIAAAPKLTVTTVVVNNNGGTKTVSDFPLFVDGSAVTSGTQTTVTAGAHTVSATGVTGYVATIGGDCAANGTITLAAGAVKACTITNSDAGLSTSVPPSAPSSVTVTATPGAHVRLTWATVPNSTNYTVKRGRVHGSETVLAAGLTTTNFTDGSTIKGLRYYYVITAVNESGESVASYEVSITPGRAIDGDFDSDGKTDIAVFRPSDGIWYIVDSSTGTPVGIRWGVGGDIPVRGDFDGDGISDLAVYRPSTGYWYILKSSSNFTTYVAQQWGVSTDMPVSGDFDGDGISDLAVYRSSTGYWYILKSSSNFTTYVAQQWGVSTDMPVSGDFDGDGISDLAVYRPSTGYWYILKSSSNFTTYVAQQWGVSTDMPVSGDFDGDGISDLAVYRPSTGYWYILKSSSNFTAYVAQQWGVSTDMPVSGDFDGDGISDLAVYRPSTGYWYILKSSSNFTTYVAQQWGESGDVPIK